MKKILIILLFFLALSGCSKKELSEEELLNQQTHFPSKDIITYAIDRGVYDVSGKESEEGKDLELKVMYDEKALVGWYNDYYYSGSNQEEAEIYKSLKRGDKIIFNSDNSLSGVYLIEAVETGSLVDGNIVGDITGEVLKDNNSKEIILEDGDKWHIVHIVYGDDITFDYDKREYILPTSPLIKD